MKSSHSMAVRRARISQFFSRVNRRTLLIACGLVVVAIGYTAFRDAGILGTWRLSRMDAQVKSDNRSIREENARIKQEVNDLRYNRSRVEMEARKLGYIYPDERVIYVPLENGTTVRIFVRPDNTAKPTQKGGVEKSGAGTTFRVLDIALSHPVRISDLGGNGLHENRRSVRIDLCIAEG